MTKTIYSFPEPREIEKTTTWGAPIAAQFVDNELEEAKRRTALIKERMSPPGALGLPPLLEEHRLKYGIPDGAFASQALFDRIHVFPIDFAEGEAIEKTTGGIYKPNVTKLKDKQQGNRGVLISAGLTAMDRLMSHGVELGDVVVTNKNVPFARVCEDISNFILYYLVMREADLASDETLAQRIRTGKQRIMDLGIEGYEHQVSDIGEDQIIDNIRKKKSVYINDTW